MGFYDQKDQTISMANESAFRTTGSGKDTAIAAGVATYGLPILVTNADIPIPIRVREEIHGVGSGKYPSKIINKTNEPINFTLEGPMLLGTFLSYAVGQSYTSTAAQPEITRVDCIADVAGSLNNKYFVIYDGATDYGVWLDVDNGGSDPTGAGITGIEVDISANDTAATIAAAINTTVGGHAEFTTTYTATQDHIEIYPTGGVVAEIDAYDVDTDFRVFVIEQGTPATTLAHRFLENADYQMDSFTVHVEQRLSGQDILYDMIGCVVDTLDIEFNKDAGTVNCSVGIKAAGYVAGTAQTTPPAELAVEPFVWGDLDNSTKTSWYRLLDEQGTERAPTSIESIKLTINNNVEFVPGIGDPIGAYAKSGKREILLNIVGFIENKTLYDYWRGTFDNANERMNSASSKMSGLIRLERTAITDVLTIFLHNIYLAEHDCHIQSIDESIKAVDMTLRAAQPDVDKRQIYANEITSTTYTKVYFGNTDES